MPSRILSFVLIILGMSSLSTFAAETINVSGTCVIYGSRIAGSYDGLLEDIIDKAGKPRRIGALMLTGDGIEARLEELTSKFGEDFDRFGAFRMQAPHNVQIASTESVQNSHILAYG